MRTQPIHAISGPGDRIFGRSGHSLTAIISWPREAFFPVGSPYLGRTARWEPVRKRNVLFPDRRHL
jgi:hypothetical protein